jgi:hypothetical protein
MRLSAQNRRKWCSSIHIQTHIWAQWLTCRNGDNQCINPRSNYHHRSQCLYRNPLVLLRLCTVVFPMVRHCRTRRRREHYRTPGLGYRPKLRLRQMAELRLFLGSEDQQSELPQWWVYPQQQRLQLEHYQSAKDQDSNDHPQRLRPIFHQWIFEEVWRYNKQ